MTSIAVAKLIIDGLLLCSILFVAFRLLGKQQPGTIANLAKLKELENSLKEIVREADDASNNLSQELLGRKRDLEKVLTEAEGAEIRFNKSKSSVEELVSAAASAQTRLEQLISKQSEIITQQNTARSAVTEPQISRPAYTAAREIPAVQNQQAHYTESFNYEEMLEPPSFQREKRPVTLREQIEIDQSEYLTQRPVQRPVVSRQEEPEVSRTTQIRQDPRLGVLGALSKEPNLY